MALNFPGPYQLRYKYDYDGITHEMALNMDCLNAPVIGDAFTDITIKLKDGTNKQLSLVTVEFFTVLKALLHTSQTIYGLEFWKYEPLTFDAEFIASDALTVVGIHGTVPTAGFYSTYSFRSGEGGIAYIKLPECAITSNARRSFASISMGEQSLVNYVIASDSPVLARDTSFLYSFYRSSGGTDERLWRRRYRQ